MPPREHLIHYIKVFAWIFKTFETWIIESIDRIRDSSICYGYSSYPDIGPMYTKFVPQDNGQWVEYDEPSTGFHGVINLFRELLSLPVTMEHHGMFQFYNPITLEPQESITVSIKIGDSK